MPFQWGYRSCSKWIIVPSSPEVKAWPSCSVSHNNYEPFQQFILHTISTTSPLPHWVPLALSPLLWCAQPMVFQLLPKSMSIFCNGHWFVRWHWDYSSTHWRRCLFASFFGTPRERVIFLSCDRWVRHWGHNFCSVLSRVDRRQNILRGVRGGSYRLTLREIGIIAFYY